MTSIGQPIAEQDRTLAVLTHLSGLAGYIVPLGGIVVPIVIWASKSESPLIVAIAKQAIILNVAVFVTIVVSFTLWVTILLIPVIVLLWVALAVVAVALPVLGAVKASQGEYYRYPVVGVSLD